MGKIVYIQGLFGKPEELEAYKETLIQFMENPNHPGLEFEKFKGGDNQKRRLILTKINNNGRTEWVLLEVVEDHDRYYENTRFLHQQTRKTFLEKHMPGAEEDNEGADFVPFKYVFEESESDSESGVVEFEERLYYNQKFLLLDDAQKSIRQSF